MSCLTRNFGEDAHNEGFGKNRAVGEVALKPLTGGQRAKPTGAWRGEDGTIWKGKPTFITGGGAGSSPLPGAPLSPSRQQGLSQAPSPPPMGLPSRSHTRTGALPLRPNAPRAFSSASSTCNAQRRFPGGETAPIILIP